MDTVRWITGAVLIAVGVPLFFLARYFEAPENKKQQRARMLKLIGIVWMAVGVLLYLVNLLTHV